MLAASQPGYDDRPGTGAFNNRSAGSTNDTTYAVCAKRPAGYLHVHGTGSVAGPGSQLGVTVSCPAGTVVLGGGGGPTVFWNGLTDLNSTVP